MHADVDRAPGKALNLNPCGKRSEVRLQGGVPSGNHGARRGSVSVQNVVATHRLLADS